MTHRSPKYWAVIPAAGTSQRMQSKIPKQYMQLNQYTVIEHTVSIFTSHQLIEKVIVVLSAEDKNWSSLNIRNPEKIATTIGGHKRAVSVMNGLEYLQTMAAAKDWLLVHDAVRPCLSSDKLDTFIKTVADHRIGGLLALPIVDTIKQIDADHGVRNTIPRRDLWAAQTPQMFRYGFLFDAMKQALASNIEITDESSAIEYLGEHPLAVKGDWRNIKITTLDDLQQTKIYLEQS